MPAGQDELITKQKNPDVATFHSELEAALAAGRQVRKEEDKQLRAAMQEDQAFQQERKESKPNPAEPERQSMGIFSTSGESLFHR